MSDYNNLIGKSISILSRHRQAYITKNLKQYNLGFGQYPFLLVLYNNDGISQDKLSELLKIDKGTTAKALKKLEGEGYITREVDTDDRRAYKVYSTDKALVIRPFILEVLNNCSYILSLNFTEEEKDLALKILSKMSENAILLLK